MAVTLPRKSCAADRSF
jgi:hypothetical protein